MIKKLLSGLGDWMDYNRLTLTKNGWTVWRNEFKKNAPIRYFIYEYVNFSAITNKWGTVCNWIRHRTYDRYHIVDTKLPCGYYDKDHIMLHAIFSLLVDYVEIECAWMNVVCSQKKSVMKRMFFRSPELGIDYLTWAVSLSDINSKNFTTHCDGQSFNASEALALYNWWTNERPNRTEVPYPPVSGAGASTLIPFNFALHAEASACDISNDLHISDYYRMSTAQEIFFDEEDDAMCARLVKIRRSLWT